MLFGLQKIFALERALISKPPPIYKFLLIYAVSVAPVFWGAASVHAATEREAVVVEVAQPGRQASVLPPRLPRPANAPVLGIADKDLRSFPNVPVEKAAVTQGRGGALPAAVRFEAEPVVLTASSHGSPARATASDAPKVDGVPIIAAQQPAE